MNRKWKSIRIVLYGPAFFIPLIAFALSLAACGTSLYPDSKGYRYDAEKINSSKNQDSKDASNGNDKQGNSSTTKTPSTKAPTGKGNTSGGAADDDSDSNESGNSDDTAEDDQKDPNPTKDPDPAPKIDGAQLYAKKCAACHGGIASNNVTNRTAVGIKNAIARVGVMSAIKLTAEELTAIELAFKAKFDFVD